MPYVFVSELDHAGWSGDNFDARKQTNASLDPGNHGKTKFGYSMYVWEGETERTGVVSSIE